MLNYSMFNSQFKNSKLKMREAHNSKLKTQNAQSAQFKTQNSKFKIQRMITLHELLASRDARHATQQKLLAEHSGKTLVCLTVVMPGSVKRNQQSLTAAHAAVEAMRKAFGQEQLLELDLETGYEAYLITPMPLLEAKGIAVNIEDTHPLGRLFDIDIINADGVPVSRDAIGEKPRRCLVCDHEARYCMRMRWHTQEEIWAKINEMVDSYVEARKS